MEERREADLEVGAEALRVVAPAVPTESVRVVSLASGELVGHVAAPGAMGR